MKFVFEIEPKRQKINLYCGRHFGYDRRKTKLKITETKNQ